MSIIGGSSLRSTTPLVATSASPLEAIFTFVIDTEIEAWTFALPTFSALKTALRFTTPITNV